ncbi:MAG: urea ABC transporter substrate-binding protein [Gammaproteobacteria bacterium]|nr:urea ABC transporter substrate-binding protein [Gammaproteobacteria bacterium]
MAVNTGFYAWLKQGLQRGWLWLFAASFLAIASLAIGFGWPAKPILVGVVHSQTGTMASAEGGVLQMTLAAINLLNEQGGVLGRPVKAVVMDGASDGERFAQAVDELIVDHGVVAIFGGWTSASRRAMLPVIEQHKGLLIYPVQYEGLEESQRIIYTGTTPNQQLNIAITWMLEHFGSRVLLVGSDNIFPRVENSIAQLVLKRLGAQVCGEYYIKSGSSKVDGLAKMVNECRPDFIINTVNGSDNLALMQLLRQDEAKIPVMSLSMDEQQLQQLIVALGERVAREHYVATSYLSALETQENLEFKAQVANATNHQLDVRYISAAMKSAWDGVFLWAQAVNAASELSAEQVVHAIEGMSYASATGPVTVDPFNRHLWQPVFIGKAQANGQFALEWQSTSLVEPEPWPLVLPKHAWQRVVQSWYDFWGQQWQAP